ncbi:U-scoloptoxin(05)-Er1a isoform X2 [Dendroctonus ponderosae]|uniref:U-scoloptoxin(05)-Er1a isoform X2 n=1 Tax=Dendroctonus ponderosae TaxID=77166 RepID=UPI002035D37D|nr:U-scoloptoxin(05)-Er1a isoform X2 [Dendroctonus ponderosae]
MACSHFLFSFLFIAFIATSTALNCYQCNGSDSSKPFQCNEWLTADIDIKPEPCDAVYGAKYCIKTTGRFQGIGTSRYCSSNHMGNYCNYVKQPGDTLWYRSCIYTCTGDGCNHAHASTSSINIVFVCVVGVLLRTILS